jgi:hypothetical protein
MADVILDTPIAAPAKPAAIFRNLVHNPGVVFGATVILIVLLMALLALWLGTIDPTAINPIARNKVPGAEFSLRTGQLFGDLLLFVYHCFDRIVIHGYLSGLSRPEQGVHFFRNVVGISVLSKEILSQRTADYQNWVERGWPAAVIEHGLGPLRSPCSPQLRRHRRPSGPGLAFDLQIDVLRDPAERPDDVYFGLNMARVMRAHGLRAIDRSGPMN